MARKNDLSSKLEGSTGRQPGWRDTIRPAQQPTSRRTPQREEQEQKGPEKTRESPLKRKTYLLTPELIDQIASLAEEERVGINELVRFLLRSALDQVVADEMEIPTRPAKRRIVDTG